MDTTIPQESLIEWEGNWRALQPEGAPDDGFNLDTVSAYAFGLPAGTGGSFAIIDHVQLIVIPGVSMPEFPVEEVTTVPAAELTPAQVEEVVLNEVLLEPMAYAEPILIADFEQGVAYVSQADGPAIGFVPWGDATANAIIGITQVMPFTELAIPLSVAPNQIMRIDYNIGAWGEFTYAFSDGYTWLSQDWTHHYAFSFWLHGNNTGQIVQIELFDNRDPESNADSAERFFYHLLDDYGGWQHFTIPFAFFHRRSDWQPNGAPDDGFNLDAVWGFAFGFPGGVGAKTAYLDQVEIVVVDDPSQVATSAQTSVTEVVVDESIGWDTRDWTLLWSDGFDGAAGSAINAESWTCEVGGHGWGNNEMEYYTDRTENVALDGDGHLIITARE